MARTTLIWNPHPSVMRLRIDRLGVRVRAGIGDLMQAAAMTAERRAKGDAPWTDRTGNARAGLKGTSDVGPDHAEMALSGSVFYQVYLELAHQGRWAIIIPTMQNMHTYVNNGLRHLMERR